MANYRNRYANYRHRYNDDGLCIYCWHDGAESSFYSQRGYAHEYEGTEYCKKNTNPSDMLDDDGYPLG